MPGSISTAGKNVAVSRTSLQAVVAGAQPNREFREVASAGKAIADSNQRCGVAPPRFVAARHHISHFVQEFERMPLRRESRLGFELAQRFDKLTGDAVKVAIVSARG